MIELAIDVKDPQYELVSLQFGKEQEAFCQMFSKTQYESINDNYSKYFSALNNKTSLDR